MIRVQIDTPDASRPWEGRFDVDTPEEAALLLARQMAAEDPNQIHAVNRSPSDRDAFIVGTARFAIAWDSADVPIAVERNPRALAAVLDGLPESPEPTAAEAAGRNTMEATTPPEPRGARFEVLEGTGEQPWYWHLKSANGEIVAQSEGYGTEADAHRGVQDALVAFDGAAIRLAPEEASAGVERARARSTVRMLGSIVSRGVELDDETEGRLLGAGIDSLGWLLLSVEASLSVLAAAASGADPQD